MSHGNMNIPRKDDMDREDEEEMNIYANVDPINGSDVRTETENSQTPQHTGSDTVRNRSSRAALVCLVLLCLVLLTAVIVLCVHIKTKSTNYPEETHQLLTRNTNLTEERDELLTRNTNLTEERDELLTRNTNLTEERDELLTRNTNLTEERDELLTRNTNLTEERDELLTRKTNLTEERDELLTRNMQLTKERDGLSSSKLDLIKHRDQLNKEKNYLSESLREKDGWIYYKSSLYFLSSEKKSWTESRRYCTERGADLIIINNREELDFVKKKHRDVNVWIGLSDRDVEGRWKWVDGSTLNSGFWASGEPNGGNHEDCALNYNPGFADYPCNDAFKWICEDVILK
ncbi:asialoglycoprotein receptor 1-like [Rhinichthys klamathensis goyatoka]|uniref:asialoglycoprotein receptor 1-like n=1 Tax=Rhinichthys klamathensis goyatoka TaxID=3034132 RepID=UPI0024B50302|nr:asialoglycoprotein receptor 1-like [Rhinichthys klamathensis goyatoka]